MTQFLSTGSGRDRGIAMSKQSEFAVILKMNPLFSEIGADELQRLASLSAPPAKASIVNCSFGARTEFWIFSAAAFCRTT
jgi:hypothetical protein